MGRTKGARNIKTILTESKDLCEYCGKIDDTVELIYLGKAMGYKCWEKQCLTNKKIGGDAGKNSMANEPPEPDKNKSKCTNTSTQSSVRKKEMLNAKRGDIK